MNTQITLPVIWAYDNVQITEDGRPWLVENFTAQRLVYKVHSGLPMLRIHSVWRSMRWLCRKQIKAINENSKLIMPRTLTMEATQERQPVRGDNDTLNNVVLECIHNGYFTRSIQHGTHINWEIFFPEQLQPKPKPKMIRSEYPTLRDRIVDFVFNPKAMA